jgi:RNase P/RNase MRP subunit p29
MNACFTESEARNRVGAEVLTVTDLPEVPVGTRGRVIHATKNGVRGWTVTIEWDLPARRTAVLAQLGEFSINIPWWTRTPAAEFSKSEVEQLLKPVALD